MTAYDDLNRLDDVSFTDMDAQSIERRIIDNYQNHIFDTDGYDLKHLAKDDIKSPSGNLYKYKLNGISDYMIVNALSQNDADERFKKAHHPVVDIVIVSY